MGALAACGSRLVGATLVGVLVSACAQSRGRGPAPTVGTTATVSDLQLKPRVPALPPDSVPTFPAGGLVSGAPLGRDSVERGVVIVMFWPNTPQAARQAAIDAIHGSVIGGLVIDNGDGFYYVRIPDDGTAASVASALTALDAMPQVELAIPAEPNALRASQLLH